jgi:DNA-3-methyladenine glycosylase II
MTTEEGPWSAEGERQPDWSEATRHLSRNDPVLAGLIARLGPCLLVPRPNTFGSLVGAIVAQQISAAAARTIHGRLWALTRGRPPGPRDILKRREATLRRVGLSRQKIGYLRDLAARVENGELDLAALETMDDDAVRAALTAVKGIGNWTADMHLIFTQNRPDVFAPGDAAVLYAMRDLYGLPGDAPAAEYERISDGWRPFRSIGVWYMYEHIHALRAERSAGA